MQINGYIRWYDKVSDDGILTDMNGNEYYFNSWSFSRTRYLVSGVCKKTGKKKTISTRSFPGLFLSKKQIKDKRTEKIKYKTGVSFEQAKGIEKNWAVNIKIKNSLKPIILESHLIRLLDSLESEKDGAWIVYFNKKLNSLLEEIIAH